MNQLQSTLRDSVTSGANVLASTCQIASLLSWFSMDFYLRSRKKDSAQEFENLGHIVQKISALESRYQDPRGARYQKRISHVDSSGSDSEEEADIGLVK